MVRFSRGNFGDEAIVPPPDIDDRVGKSRCCKLRVNLLFLQKKESATVHPARSNKTMFSLSPVRKTYAHLHGANAVRGNSHGESAGYEAPDAGNLRGTDQGQLRLQDIRRNRRDYNILPLQRFY